MIKFIPMIIQDCCIILGIHFCSNDLDGVGAVEAFVRTVPSQIHNFYSSILVDCCIIIGTDFIITITQLPYKYHHDLGAVKI